MTTKSLQYDMVMIRHVNDGYMYMLSYDMKMTWYICHGMRYVINWHVYDMIYCDAICYDTICIWWNVMFKAWNVMLCLLNCVYTAWYECYEITINGMKYNPVRIMYDMRNEKWEMKNEKWYDMNEKLSRGYI